MNSFRRHAVAGANRFSLVKLLETHATQILWLTVIIAAFLLWDGFASVSGGFFGPSMETSGPVLDPAVEAAGLSVAGLQIPVGSLFPAYSFKSLVVIAHVLALVMSFGAVMFLDLFLLRYLLFRPVPAHAHEVATFGSWLVTAGLAVMWLTGLTFLLIYWAVDPVKLDNPKIWAKVVVVGLLSINGMVIHNRILPMLKLKVGRRLLEGETSARAKLILATAAVSFSSWMFAFILGLSKELNFTVSGASLLLAYALLNAAVFVALNGLASAFGKQMFSQNSRPPRVEGNRRASF